jgi:hypothetical protein
MALTKTQTTVACLLLAAAPVGYQWHAAAALRRDAAETARQLATTTEALGRAEAKEVATLRRLGVLSDRLAATRSRLRRAGDQVAVAASPPDASLYFWSDSATHVRIPKSLASRLRLSGTQGVPTSAGANRHLRAFEAVGADGSLSEVLAEVLGVIPAESEAIRQAFGQTYADLQERVQGVAYLTNQVPAQFRFDGKPAATLITPALPDRGVALHDQLRGSLDRILGTERANLVWQQAVLTFAEEFNWFGSVERVQTAVFEGPGHLTLWGATRDPGGEIGGYGNTSGSLDLDRFPARLQPVVAGWLANSQPQSP